MAHLETIRFFAFALGSLLCFSMRASSQDRLIALSKIVEKAEKLQPYDLHDHYFVEISPYDEFATQTGEQCYQIWSAKADRVLPHYAGVVISTSGKTWTLSPPQILRRSPYEGQKPRISLRQAILRAEKYVDENNLLRESDHLNIAYLITMPNGRQHWHICGDHVSLFVFMDGSVQQTTEL